MSKEHQVRTKYIIHPKFQYTLLLINFIIFVVTFLVVLITSYVSYNDKVTSAMSLKIPQNHAYYQHLYELYNDIFKYLSITMPIALILSIVLTVWISHRFAGPIVRLKSYFDEIAQSGEVKNLKFREDDYFIELPESINKALDKVKK